MMFEGCPAPHLGCTILLRGASGQDLAKLKKVTKEYIFALYNSYLELSYLMDAEAQPPSPSDNVFEDSEGEIKSHYEENPHKRIRFVNIFCFYDVVIFIQASLFYFYTVFL